MNEGRRGKKVALARQLRRDPTPSENRLWECVLRQDRTGFHFRRQEPIAGFVVDFCCMRSRVIVEVDGGVHLSRAEADEERTAVLTAHGYLVVRFTNEQVTMDLREVRDSIIRACKAREAPTSGRGPDRSS